MRLYNLYIIRDRFKKILVSSILVMHLVGCAGYSSEFICPDAKGANCTSMGNVHRMIQSGEIEIFNEQNKKCRGKSCKKYKYIKSPSKKIPKKKSN